MPRSWVPVNQVQGCNTICNTKKNYHSGCICRIMAHLITRLVKCIKEQKRNFILCFLHTKLKKSSQVLGNGKQKRNSHSHTNHKQFILLPKLELLFLPLPSSQILEDSPLQVKQTIGDSLEALFYKISISSQEKENTTTPKNSSDQNCTKLLFSNFPLLDSLIGISVCD